MHLYRVGYRSEVKGTLNKDDLRDILSASSTNNMQNSLSGALLFNQNVFLQIL